MSVANALAFLRQVRGDVELRRGLAAAPRGTEMQALCELARGAGKPCLASHVEEAFRIEWVARRVHFEARAAAQRPRLGAPALNDPPRVE